jgi:GT2 family glycosyltransferase
MDTKLTHIQVSIIIVSYNTKFLLKQCLDSIIKHTLDIQYEIIISDNGSTDGSIAMLHKDYPEIIVVENKDNIGFGAANNRAADISNGDYLFFLNSDTLLTNNAIKIFYDDSIQNNRNLIGCYLKHEDGVYCNSYQNYTRAFSSFARIVYFSFPFFKRLHDKFAIKKMPVSIMLEVKTVDFIVGADIFIAKDLFTTINGFDEGFFMYYEDDDLCRRATNTGMSAYIIPGPGIMHLESGSTTYNAQQLKIREKSYFHYIKKYYGNKMKLIRFCFFVYAVLRFFSPCWTKKEKIDLLTAFRKEYER